MSERQRAGFSAAEMVIGILVLAVALTPIYSTFISSSKSVSSSRFAYMSLQVARETMEELRQVPFETLEDFAAANYGDKAPLGGAALFRNVTKSRSVTSGNDDPNGVNKDGPTYPAEYNRIKVAVKVEKLPPLHVTDPPAPTTMKKVTLDVQWEESGGKAEKDRSGLLHFVTIVANHSVDPEVFEP